MWWRESEKIWNLNKAPDCFKKKTAFVYHQATDAAESLRKPVWTGTELAAQSFARWWPRCEHSLTTMILHTQTGKGDTDMPLWNRHNSAVPDYWCDWKENIWIDHRWMQPHRTGCRYRNRKERRGWQQPMIGANTCFLRAQQRNAMHPALHTRVANRSGDAIEHGTRELFYLITIILSSSKKECNSSTILYFSSLTLTNYR